MKRFILIGVLFCVVMFNVVYANGENAEKNDELYEVKKVIERKLNYEDLINIKKPTFEDWISTEIFIDIPLFNKVFPKAELVIQISDIYKPSRKRIVSKYKGKQYGILAINLLYNQTKNETKSSMEDRIRLYFKFKSISTKLTKGNIMGQKRKTFEFKITSIKRVEKKQNEKGIIHDYKYKVQVMYNKEITDYFFYIENDNIKRIEYFKDGKFDGSLPILQPKIKNEKQSRTINFSAGGINVVQETVITPTTLPHTYEHYYLKVSDNGSATNDTIKIQITGLTPLHSNTRLQIEPLYGYGGILVLDQLLAVDSLGTASYTWTPPNNNQTGFMKVRVNVSGSNTFWQDTYIIPEHTKTGTFTSGYDYTIYYCNQFFSGHTDPQGIDYAQTFAGIVETAVIESWIKQVNDWNLALGCTGDQPTDGDGNYEIFINDSDINNCYHATYSTWQEPGTERKIAVNYDIYINYYPFYTSEENLLKSAICHEFYHGIQWSLNGYWGGRDWDWMIEGQARFLQTVQYLDEEFNNATTQHLYRNNSNEYLQDWLNRSLITNYGTPSNPDYMSYKYCLFWRLLFENYTTGSTADSLEIIRETCRGNINHNLPDIEAFMDSKLNGTYDTMDDAIEDFSKRCYLNDPTDYLWNPCPSNGFYTSPPITNDSDSDGITDTFSGNPIIEPNSIPSSFGIDYMVFDFDEEVSFVTLHFEGDPDEDSDMADFYVNVLFFEGTTLISENEVTLTNGEGSLGFIVNDPIDKVVIIIVRLDADESTSDNDYFIKLTQGIDVSLVIDSSGSMEGDKIVQAKNASNQFVALLNHGSNIAVSSFHQYATVNFPLTVIESNQTKLNAQNAINSIIIGGYTSIGAGIQSGQGELNNNSTPNYPQAMILLSDGQENRSPYVVDILPTIPEETDIYTIGLGDGADALLLSQIANYTDGFYFFSPGPSGLSNIFNTIMQKVSDNQEIASFPGTISGGSREEILHDVIIDGSMQETTFSLLWQNSSNDLDLELIAPDNTIIDPSYATTDPYVSFSSFPAIEFYTVTLPDSGQWTLKVIGAIIAETEDYVASVSGYSDLQLDIAFDNDNYIIQDTVTVTAILTDDEVPIIGAVVEAEIEIPTRNEGEILKEIYKYKKKNGIDEDFVLNEKLEFESYKDRSIRTDSLTLYDDGNHGDGDANDGVYGNFYTNTSTIGSYSFNISASGTSPIAGPFTRQSFHSIFILEHPEIEFSTTIIDFGDVIINTIGTFNLYIYNTASSAANNLDVTNIQSTNPLFQPDTTELSILAGSAETLTITFSSTAIDSFECNLLMQSNDPDEHSIQLTMKGNCILSPAAIINVPADQLTIQNGINAAKNTATVLVQPGTYVENINYNGKLITVASLFFTTRDTTYITSTIIDGNSIGSVVTFNNSEDSTTVLCGFTITNGSAEEGGGIKCSESSPILQNITISGNSAVSDGGGIYCASSSPSFENVTISGNSASDNGGGIFCYNSSPTLINSILWNDSPQEIYFDPDGDPNLITISYSDIQYGEAGIVTNNNGIVNWLEGNIDENPLFVDPGSKDYHLQSTSPCIDAGDPASPFDPDCTITDMGAYYFNQHNGPTWHISTTGSDLTGTGCEQNPFSTIQHGINISSNTDTVLVQPGTYIEKINFNGKLITVGSLFLTIQDTTYITSTIINGNNSGSVVTFNNSEDSTTVLCGFTITNGFYSDGGGIYCYNSSPSLVNVTISGNSASGSSGYGGGIYCMDNSSPYLENVIISGNSATSGGGIYCSESSPSLTNVIISGNSATYGCGLFCRDNSSPSFENVTISDNSANFGGGIYCYNNSNPSLVDVTISGNSATIKGGGIYCGSSSPSLQNVTITDNSADNYGGGIECHNNSSPSLQNVTITGNSAGWNGGGIYCNDSSPNLENVTITGNSATYDGGGIYCMDNPSPSLVNVTISCNSVSYYGGGIYCYGSSPNLENVTITGNSATYDGGGIYCYASSPSIINSILWNDLPQEIYILSGTVTATYSDIQGGFTGTGNIDSDPLFVDPEIGDYHLSWANFPILDDTMSPCIDAGDPNSPFDPDSTIVDMGAYFFDQTILPDPPQNVTVEIIGTDVQLSWDAVSGANSYKVYSSDDPYTGFVEDTSGSFAGESWSAPIGDVKRFYHVIASTEIIRSKNSDSYDAYHPDRKSREYDLDKFINRKRK